MQIGTDVIWTYLVFNDAPEPLTITAIGDDGGPNASFTPVDVDENNDTFNDGDLNQNRLVDMGEAWQFTSEGVVTHLVTNGQYSNLVQVLADIPSTGGTAGDTDPSNHFGVNVAVDLLKTTNSQDASAAPGVHIGVGGAATFEYEVANIGNVNLALDEIVDDNGTPGDTGDDFNPLPVDTGSTGFNDGDVNQNGLVDPGETWLFEAPQDRTVTAGQYTNVASILVTPVDAGGQDIPGFSPITADDTSNHFGATLTTNDLQLQKFTNGQDADDPTGPLLEVGTTATFTYELTLATTANVPARILLITDDNGTPSDTGDDFSPSPVESGGFNVGDINQNDLLDPDETWFFDATTTVTSGQYTNAALATVRPVSPTGDDVEQIADASATDSSNHFGAEPILVVEKSTNGEDADTPPGPVLPVGATATFDYDVTNTGNIPLGMLTLIDDNGTPGDTGDDFAPTPVESGGFNVGDLNQNDILDVGETWEFIASRTVTAGQYTNVATATANPLDFDNNDLPAISDVSAQDDSNHLGNPIRLEKATNAADPANPTTEEDADVAPGPFIAVGDSVIWTYLIFNDGTDPLMLTELVDDFGTPGNTGDDFNPASVDSGGFNVGDINQNRMVDPGEVWRFTSDGVETYTVVPDQYTNTATVSATIPSSGGTAEDTDPSNHFGADLEEGDLVLTKRTNGEDADTVPGPFLEVGTTATFDYEVTLLDRANVSANIVSLIDDNGTPGDPGDDFMPSGVETGGFNDGDVNQNGLLDQDETWLFQATRTVTAGQYGNTATLTVDGVDPGGTTIPGLDGISIEDDSNHFGVDPLLVVTKLTENEDADTPTGPLLPVGSTVNWQYELDNQGNTPLGFVSLTDDNGTPGDSGDDFNPSPVESGGFNQGDVNQNDLIDPGETWLFAASDTVVAGQYTNTAVAVANPLDLSGNDLPDIANVSGNDMSNHFGAQATVVVEKSTNGVDADTPPGVVIAVGQVATFEYEVSSDGSSNAPLSLTSIVDDNGTPGDTGDDFFACGRSTTTTTASTTAIRTWTTLSTPTKRGSSEPSAIRLPAGSSPISSR